MSVFLTLHRALGAPQVFDDIHTVAIPRTMERTSDGSDRYERDSVAVGERDRFRLCGSVFDGESRPSASVQANCSGSRNAILAGCSRENPTEPRSGSIVVGEMDRRTFRFHVRGVLLWEMFSRSRTT